MSYGPPQGGDPQLWQWFTAVDTDRSGSISLQELQQALYNGSSFSLIACGDWMTQLLACLGNWESACRIRRHHTYQLTLMT
jgi:hypothetical protein